MCTALKGMSGANVVEIGGDQSASAAVDRAKGFREGIANCTDESIKISTARTLPVGIRPSASPSWKPS
jgi:ABC-type sugar transport system substrate-binding protein